MLLCGMAGGMGWGIRGQYGHQTGAMIAGVLVGLTLILLFGQRWSALRGARVAACLTLGVSVGGSMTYGQTIGLTQDAELIGNWSALGWGMLGLFLKGAIWIALAGLLLGMAAGRVRYTPGELAGLMACAIFLRFWGIGWLNEPYVPEDKLLPTIYFSDDWDWEPTVELKPRRELWGGLLLAWAALTAYARWVRGDVLAFRLALIGFISGGLGFSLGQCIQATHAWNPQWFEQGLLSGISPYINWWNMMEISFGAIFAAGLALGVWLWQDWLEVEQGTGEPSWANRHERSRHESGGLSPVQEGLLGMVHVAAVVSWSFGSNTSLGAFAGIGYTMILLPLLAVASGRYWPYLQLFPIVLIPIAGKTLRRLCYESEQLPPATGWWLIVIIPLSLAVLATWLGARYSLRHSARGLAGWALPGAAALYFGLNYAFFEFPWPWGTWTTRTPSGLIFSACLAGLCWGAVYYNRVVTRQHHAS